MNFNQQSKSSQPPTYQNYPTKSYSPFQRAEGPPLKLYLHSLDTNDLFPIQINSKTTIFEILNILKKKHQRKNIEEFLLYFNEQLFTGHGNTYVTNVLQGKQNVEYKIKNYGNKKQPFSPQAPNNQNHQQESPVKNTYQQQSPNTTSSKEGMAMKQQLFNQSQSIPKQVPGQFNQKNNVNSSQFNSDSQQQHFEEQKQEQPKFTKIDNKSVPDQYQNFPPNATQLSDLNVAAQFLELREKVEQLERKSNVQQNDIQTLKAQQLEYQIIISSLKEELIKCKSQIQQTESQKQQQQSPTKSIFLNVQQQQKSKESPIKQQYQKIEEECIPNQSQQSQIFNINSLLQTTILLTLPCCKKQIRKQILQEQLSQAISQKIIVKCQHCGKTLKNSICLQLEYSGQIYLEQKNQLEVEKVLNSPSIQRFGQVTKCPNKFCSFKFILRYSPDSTQEPMFYCPICLKFAIHNPFYKLPGCQQYAMPLQSQSYTYEYL